MDYIKRMEDELNEVTKRFEKLELYLETHHYATLSVEERKLMEKQYYTMRDYIGTLRERIVLAIDKDSK